MQDNFISQKALRLAEEFLASARPEILELAEDDLELLRNSATALRAAATDRTSQGKSSEHVAYALVASAFNEALANRKGGARRPTPSPPS